ncbi:MAG: hypothetical protein QGG71_11075, partial [Pirellulaceae bacterium]|nr:hypothetical protein [Pirellulaceae bacterium]
VSGTFDDPALGVSTEVFGGAAVWSDGVITPLAVDGTAGTFSTSRTFLDDDPSTGTASDPFTVDITITDDDLGSDFETSPVLTVNNVEPEILSMSLSSSSIDESQSVTVSGTFDDPALGVSTEVFGGAAVWSDGAITPLTVNGTAGTFSTSRTFLDDDPTGTPSDPYTVDITITDDDLGSDVETSPVLTVNNVAPTIGAVNVNATKDNKVMPGDDVTLAATFTDIGLLDRHDVVIQWDDGTSNSIFDVDATAGLVVGDTFTSTSGNGSVLTITNVILATGETSFLVESHQFGTGGIFEIIITITDDDTGSDTDGTQAWVSGVRLTGGVLQVIGTSDDDHVTINKQGNGILKVHADFLQSGNFETFNLADVDKIIAHLCAGDDHLTIAGNVDIPAIVHGDGGNDHLNAGGGPTVLLGHDGDDMLVGGSGRDILIGGLGADRLVGGNSDDVLIGGTTNADDDDDALMELLAAWTSNDSYEDRVDAIDALLTVFDDEEEDKLTGSSGRDLFYDGLGDILTDVKTKKNPETVR